MGPQSENPNYTPLPQAPPAPEAATPAPTMPVPNTWPGAFGAYKYSRAAVLFNGNTIGILLVLAFACGFIQLIPHFRAEGFILNLVISSFFGTTLYMAYLAGVRGQRLSMGQALSQSFPLLLKMVGLYILIYISIIISFLLLIIPFFFVLPRVVLAPYYLIDKKLGVVEAYKASWHATKGHESKVWGTFGVNILIVMVSITIIGIILTIYWGIMYSAVFAVLYAYIDRMQEAGTAATATPTAALQSPPVV
jgi:hypothetical protein